VFTESKSGILLWQGPPGTGKTHAIAKLISHFLKTSSKNILICAHSNEAVFNVASALLKLNVDHELIHWALPLEFVKQYSQNPRLRLMINPTSNKSHKKKRIFLSTCNYSHKFSPMVFDTVVLDEAAFCPEMDSMVCILRLNTTHCSILILAGDPQQLPPVLKMFRRYQLCGSLMGRCSITSSTNFITFNESYRVGPLCATYLQATFYSHISYFKGCEFTQNHTILRGGKPFPEMVFIHVDTGQEEMCKKSKFNTIEGIIVNRVVCALLRNGVMKTEIGIMTPYTEQRRSIISHTSNTDSKGTHVASVHEMQGSERKFIIFNSVCTNNTGFLDDPHIMCVSLSRQKVFLIVVRT
jgi:DNA replication ATP-dependent helicase Dna2